MWPGTNLIRLCLVDGSEIAVPGSQDGQVWLQHEEETEEENEGRVVAGERRYRAAAGGKTGVVPMT